MYSTLVLFIKAIGTLCALLMLGTFLRAKVPVFQNLYLPASVIGGFFMFQCMLGILAAMFSRLIGVNTYDVMGLELAYGFNGGHGMAASLGSALQDFGNSNWQSAQDAAMTTATVGLIGGILLGIVIINWGIKKGYTSQVKAAAKSSTEMRTGLYAKDAELPEMCKQTTIPNSIETLSLHLALIIGVSAIMSINVKLLSTYWVALAITCVLGLVVTPLCIIFICKKFCRTNWFEKSLGCIGANTGVFVTGILLIKMVDPDIKTDALTDYSIGGTLCNLFVMPLISLAIGIMGSSGPIAALVFSVITSIACFAPILVSGLTIGRKKTAE